MNKNRVESLLYEHFDIAESEVKYYIRKDLSVTVSSDIALTSALQELPVVFNVIKGSFNVNCGTLQTLKGCPKEVGGDFDCSRNQLESLKYCPKIVCGSFYCDGNDLYTLTGGPEEVYGMYICDENPRLGSIEHIASKGVTRIVCDDRHKSSKEYKWFLIKERLCDPKPSRDLRARFY